MVQSQSEMLFESMCKCRIQIPLEILLLLDQKILKIDPEMAELAFSLGYCFSLDQKVFHYHRHILGLDNRYRTEKLAAPLLDSLQHYYSVVNPFILHFTLEFFGEMLIPAIIAWGLGRQLISSLYRTKMAPWDQLSTKDRNMASSKEWNVVRIDA